MKCIVKIVSILMAFLLLISSFGVHAVYSAENADLPEELVAAADTPVIALTHVPKYGEVSPFEGSVFMENGSGFSPYISFSVSSSLTPVSSQQASVFLLS